jgi:hypothetical protein
LPFGFAVSVWTLIDSLKPDKFIIDIHWEKCWMGKKSDGEL